MYCTVLLFAATMTECAAVVIKYLKKESTEIQKFYSAIFGRRSGKFSEIKRIVIKSMDKNSYAELMYIWGIDRMDAKRGFRWRVIFSRFFSKFHASKVPQDKCTDEMKYTAELAERMANFVLEDDCNEQ